MDLEYVRGDGQKVLRSVLLHTLLFQCRGHHKEHPSPAQPKL